MATIELRKVEKKFGTAYAVKPMDLKINDGEFVVLLGPSGCGKTTTLRMISGLEAVTDGQILLNDRNVTWRHPSDRDIAFVFQLYALYPHIKVRDNIAFPLNAQHESKDVIDQRVKEVVELLRIQHLLNARPGSLSGGDKQRVALARALERLLDRLAGAGKHLMKLIRGEPRIQWLRPQRRIVALPGSLIQQTKRPQPPDVPVDQLPPVVEPDGQHVVVRFLLAAGSVGHEE